MCALQIYVKPRASELSPPAGRGWNFNGVGRDVAQQVIYETEKSGAFSNVCMAADAIRGSKKQWEQKAKIYVSQTITVTWHFIFIIVHKGLFWALAVACHASGFLRCMLQPNCCILGLLNTPAIAEIIFPFSSQPFNIVHTKCDF